MITPIQVVCPFCNASPGFRCKTGHYGAARTKPHKDRIVAAQAAQPDG